MYTNKDKWVGQAVRGEDADYIPGFDDGEQQFIKDEIDEDLKLPLHYNEVEIATKLQGTNAY